jgi:hypothetical protein
VNWKKAVLLALILLLTVFVLSGCAQTNQAIDTAGKSGVAGFWPGLWHGFIMPVSFIISLFDDSVGIYEIHNNGNWYNFGFVLGASVIFGSVLASKNR